MGRDEKGWTLGRRDREIIEDPEHWREIQAELEELAEIGRLDKATDERLERRAALVLKLRERGLTFDAMAIFYAKTTPTTDRVTLTYSHKRALAAAAKKAAEDPQEEA